jgi:hypothetical protein
MKKAYVFPVLLRFVLAMLIAVAFGILVGEGSYQSLKESDREAPEEFELIIPAGTADLIASGSNVPSIPTNMKFIEGDVLVVHNEDTAGHQLGPVFVPPGASGTLNLETPQKYSLACTFQPTKYLGIDVQPRTTLGLRVQGVLAIALPTGVLMWLYSLLIFPLDKAVKPQAGAA